LLLAVYHDLDAEHCEHMKSQGLDPADWVGVDDLGRLLDGDVTSSCSRSCRASTRRLALRTSPMSSYAPGVADRSAGCRRQDWHPRRADRPTRERER
jgi:hypothetical protein